MPSRTACDLKPETVSILSEHKNIVGLKEAVDDIERIKELVKISKNSSNFAILFLVMILPFECFDRRCSRSNICCS